MNIKTNISFLVHAISSYNRVSKVHCLPRLDQPLVIISFRYADPVNINPMQENLWTENYVM